METKRCIAFGMFAAFILVLAVPAFPAEPPGTGEGIPSTSIARLKIDKGTAWVRSGPSGEWEEAAHNYPLVEQSVISVPQGSEAEIQYRGSQSLLLHGGSEVALRRLGEKEASFRLRTGQAVLSLPKDDFSPVRFAVPGSHDVLVDTPGRYSLSIDDGTTRFLVRSGEGAVTDADGARVLVQEGEEATVGEGIRIRRVETAATEPVPETTLTGPEADAGVPPAVAGELRQYGEWVSTPQYGYAWRPYVEDGWEPYYYGRWAWVSPYGWSWVGYEPWGWWPYHTGWWWPSPVHGWVWCPFRSFASFHFAFGHSVFHGHRAHFFPANVRFVGRDRFVRWVPARPGERRSDSRSFARGDSRLARWNRQVERGSVMVRRDGGSPVAWEGRRGAIRASGAGGRNIVTDRPRSANSGGGTTGFRGRPGRSSAATPPRMRTGGIPREPARGISPSGSSGSFRGSSRSFRGPSNSIPSSPSSFRGSNRSVRSSASSFQGSTGSFRGSARSFQGSGGSFRGSGGSTRGSGGSFRGSGGSFRGSGGGSVSFGGGARGGARGTR